jgi:hypothetical protein
LSSASRRAADQSRRSELGKLSTVGFIAVTSRHEDSVTN